MGITNNSNISSRLPSTAKAATRTAPFCFSSSVFCHRTLQQPSQLVLSEHLNLLDFVRHRLAFVKQLDSVLQDYSSRISGICNVTLQFLLCGMEESILVHQHLSIKTIFERIQHISNITGEGRHRFKPLLSRYIGTKVLK